MSNKLVLLISDDGGQRYEHPAWHAINSFGDSHRTLCSGETFGPGESHCEYKYKTVIRGGITCPWCIEMIKFFKSIKL